MHGLDLLSTIEESDNLTNIIYCNSEKLIDALYLNQNLPINFYTNETLYEQSSKLKNKILKNEIELRHVSERPEIDVYVDASFKKTSHLEYVATCGYVVVKGNKVLTKGSNDFKIEVRHCQKAEILGIERTLKKLIGTYEISRIYCDNKNAIKLSNKVLEVLPYYDDQTKCACKRLQTKYKGVEKKWIPKHRKNKFHVMAHNLAYKKLKEIELR